MKASLFWLVAAVLVGSETVAEPIRVESLDGEIVTLQARVTAAKTLLLTVTEEPQLQEAFRVASLAESKDLSCLIVIALPNTSSIKIEAFKRTAKRYFLSEYSRQHIVFTHQYPMEKQARAGLFDREANAFTWSSPHYPSEDEIEGFALPSGPYTPSAAPR